MFVYVQVCIWVRKKQRRKILIIDSIPLKDTGLSVLSLLVIELTSFFKRYVPFTKCFLFTYKVSIIFLYYILNICGIFNDAFPFISDRGNFFFLPYVHTHFLELFLCG